MVSCNIQLSISQKPVGWEQRGGATSMFRLSCQKISNAAVDFFTADLSKFTAHECRTALATLHATFLFTDEIMNSTYHTDVFWMKRTIRLFIFGDACDFAWCMCDVDMWWMGQTLLKTEGVDKWVLFMIYGRGFKSEKNNWVNFGFHQKQFFQLFPFDNRVLIFDSF